jgi:hypothetical protein
MRLAPGETVAAPLAGGGAVLLGKDGLRTVTASVLSAPPPLPVLVAEPQGDLTATARAVLPRLAWQKVGDARYAVTRFKGGLLIFSDLPTGAPPLEIMASDGEPLIETIGAPVRFGPDGPVFSAVSGSWRLGGAVRLQAPEGIQRRDCVRLDPPPERLPTMPIAIRASCGASVDAADSPWWLHSGWRVVP